METNYQKPTSETKKLLDEIYPHGYKVITGHGYDSNCAGWLAHRLKPKVYEYDDEKFEPREVFHEDGSGWFNFIEKIDISNFTPDQIEKLKNKLKPMQVLTLVTESRNMVHALLYDPQEDSGMPFESKQQTGSGEFGGNNPPTRNVSLGDQINITEKLAGEKVTSIKLFELKEDL